MGPIFTPAAIGSIEPQGQHIVCIGCAPPRAGTLLFLRVVERSPPYDIEAALATSRAPRVEALIVLTSPHLFDQRARISELTMKQRLPASVGYSAASWGEAGFLIAYAGDGAKMAARAADIAASILKGAKTGEIPIEQAANYEMVINLKTAKALGITIPQSVLLRADRVIE